MQIQLSVSARARAKAAPEAAPAAQGKVKPRAKAAVEMVGAKAQTKRAVKRTAKDLAPTAMLDTLTGIAGAEVKLAKHKSIAKGYCVNIEGVARGKTSALAKLLAGIKWPKRKTGAALSVNAKNALVVKGGNGASSVTVGPIVAVSYNANSKVPRVLHVTVKDRRVAIDLFDKAAVEKLFALAEAK